jgi:hypothetical protein
LEVFLHINRIFKDKLESNDFQTLKFDDSPLSNNSHFDHMHFESIPDLDNLKSVPPKFRDPLLSLDIPIRSAQNNPFIDDVFGLLFENFNHIPPALPSRDNSSKFKISKANPIREKTNSKKFK